ncbi:four-carbon acid sugar kinase family protein [Avibacterium sp. 21-595]|uniref:3-oxo-tetronate kinase n=1 Tax=Avibacterium sp. 21-595 TaxID=2911527 RepID=UPI002026C885|nr:3-oxo-tetronate kinase [Avibacterium sp. 21-595]URL06597.1 four-carbon acid sugar kinase family protein [Avibacterium sp. 21-595]
MLGVIADDFTGASDIASFLVENGLRTVQMNGVPTQSLQDSVDAIVISLKSRSNPADEAIQQSLHALDWLKQNGCSQFYFKYCSTFDSTAKGNIGPVTDALLNALNDDFTVITPALPINGRTIFNGYLFVGDVLLNESGMRHHPITPMKDANLLRLMDAQAQGKTGLVAYADVIQGSEQVKARFAELKQQGYRYAVVDAVDNQQLAVLAEAVTEFKLVTGGSGLGAYMAARLSGGKKGENAFVPQKGKTVVLSGSCSVMTNQQVENYQKKAPHLFLNVEQAIHQPDYVDTLYQWTISNLQSPFAPMIYATVPPEQLKAIQQQFGAERASHAIEQTFACLAKKLKNAGMTNFITAGGETSSIVVQQLGFSGFHIGKQIAPGVPWLKALEEPIYLALKSGNFGKVDFFEFAQGMAV